MAYQAKFRVEEDESVGLPASSQKEDQTTAESSEKKPASSGRPNPWDTLRIVGPIISTIAEKPGFLSGNKADAVRAVDEAGTVVVREATLLREKFDKADRLNLGVYIESVSSLFDAAWKKWSENSGEGVLSEKIAEFLSVVGDVNVPVENFHFLSDALINDPMTTGKKYVDMHKAFEAIANLDESEDSEGRAFFLSRLNQLSPKIVTESWKAAEKMMFGKNPQPSDVTWPEIQIWKTGEKKTSKPLQQLVFAVSTQLALVRQVADDCQKVSPEARKEIFGEDFQKFMKGMLIAIRNDANQVENLLKDTSNFMDDKNPTQSVAFIMMTAMRESGDLRVQGMRYIVDNVLSRAPERTPENSEKIMKEYLSQPVLQENMALAKKRVSEQKKILFSPLPENVLESTASICIHLMNRNAVIDGLSPLWTKKQADKKEMMEKGATGLAHKVDAIVQDISVAAEALAERVSEKGRHDRAFCAVAERFLREVSRNALPDIVRSQDAQSIRSAHRDVLQSASEVALRVARPDLGDSAEQVVKSDMKRFSNERKIVYAGPNESSEPEKTATRSPE